jgi:hypothetical protein
MGRRCEGRNGVMQGHARYVGKDHSRQHLKKCMGGNYNEDDEVLKKLPSLCLYFELLGRPWGCGGPGQSQIFPSFL